MGVPSHPAKTGRPAGLGSAAGGVGPAVAVVLVTTVVFWLLNSVSAGDVLLFLGFTLGFVLVPGCLAYLALSGGPRPALRVAVCGAALGLALEVGFYVLAKAAGAQAIFLVYPVLVSVPAILALRGAELGRLLEPGSWSRWEVLAGGALIAGAGLALGIALSDQAAIPGELYGNRYYQDLVWEIAIAGEAKHVWPLDVPALAGEPLRYHYFANLNEAAISETTGITQPLVNFRLAPVAMVVLVAAGLLELGRTLSGRAWAGLVTMLLVLLVGRFDALPIPPGEFFKSLYLSDSFLFGLALFLPLLCELFDRFAESGERREGLARWGPWVVVSILLLGCGGGKLTILPVLAAGLGAALLYALWRRREQVGAVAVSLGLSVAAGLLSYLAFYRVEAGDADLMFVPFAIAKRTPDFAELTADLPDAAPVRIGSYAVESAAGFADVLAPLIVGLVALALLPRLRSRVEAVLIVTMLAVGLVLWGTLTQSGGAQYWFLTYPYAAAGALAAAAIVELVETDSASRRRALAVIAPVTAVLLAVAVISPRPYTDSKQLREFPDWRNLTYTKSIWEGLVWVRDNTPEDSVIAVNNSYSQPTLARNCAYTAFSERRAMLECEYGLSPFTAYPSLASLRAGEATHPHPERFRLNEGIFKRADPAAIREASDRYGVDYLVVDMRFVKYKKQIAALDRVADRVYEGDEVIVYAVPGSDA